MPIANCIITSKSEINSDGSSDLIALWANHSKKSPEHMTINIIRSVEQLGNKYAIMANLLLPSIWSNVDISSIQTGLAKALTQHYRLNKSEVHVITSLVGSGMVVEAGKELKW